LLQLLQTDTTSLRLDIIDALGRIGHPAAVPELITRLRDGDPETRAAAADALGELGSRAALAALQEMQQADSGHDSQHRPLRDIAADAIARIEAGGRALQALQNRKQPELDNRDGL